MTRGQAALGIILLFGCASAADVSNKQSPVAKVVGMMNDMMAKAKEEKQAEKMRFASFSQFCVDTTSHKKKSIERGGEDVDKAEAAIAEADAEANSLAKEIAAHENDIGIWSSDKTAAIQLRKEEHRAFKKEHAETVDAMAATAQAKQTLTEGNQEIAQASLLQLSRHPRITPHAKKIILSFLQLDPQQAFMQDAAQALGAPEAGAYQGSSGAILEVCDDLSEKETDFKGDLEKAEALRLNAHNLQVNSLEGDIKKANMMMSQKASVKSQREQDLAAAKGDLADATNAVAEDKKYLSDLNAECEVKTKDFKQRQHMRGEEITAIMKAIEIMSDSAVAGGAQHTALVQQKSPALGQLRSSSAEMQRTVQHVAARFLAERAQKMNSQVLSLLATRASSDPFGKVVKMVKAMIQKLMEEANEEAESKAFCDTEMGTNKMTRDTKTALVAELQSNIEQLTADVNELAQRVTQIQTAIGEIDASLAKATAERQAEKEKNQETIEDGKGAQAATQNALQVLKEFYEKASNQVDLPEADGPIKYDPRSLQILSKSAGGAFVQQGQKVPGAPEMESGKYTGMEGGGVVGMLEIIESDFADLIAETSASEAEALRVYEQFANDSGTDKAVKDTELQHLQDKRVQAESDTQSTKKDLRTTQKELQAAMDYFEKLKPECVQVAVSYEDKKAAREQEIESLQEALKILSQDDIA